MHGNSKCQNVQCNHYVWLPQTLLKAVTAFLYWDALYRMPQKENRVLDLGHLQLYTCTSITRDGA